jgi:MFS family permease
MRLRLGSPRFWSTAFGALAVLSFAAGIPLSVLSDQAANLVIAGVIGLPSAAIGVLITRRQPGNPLGWLFLVSAVCQFIGTDGGGYALLAYHFGHHLPLASVALALDQIWGPSLVVFAVSILLFPDGRLSRFWRWVFRVYAVAFATLLVATAVAVAGALAAHPVRVDENGGLAAVDYPVGWFNAVQGMILVLILGLSVSFIVRQALSWRRATGERRQQLKWLASGAFVTVVCLLVAGNFGSSGNGPTGPTLWGVLTSLVWFGVAALPVSIGVAILKYRLYEIDRIISRTLAYAIVTGLLVGVYAGLVLLATQVFGIHTPVAVAAATLAAAALFSPVRRRVQHAVDRRFNRARYDAEQMVTAFAARLQDAVDTDAVHADLAGMVHTALEPTHVSVWLQQ